jgi:hypothetical protein
LKKPAQVWPVTCLNWTQHWLPVDTSRKPRGRIKCIW